MRAKLHSSVARKQKFIPPEKLSMHIPRPAADFFFPEKGFCIMQFQVG
jgi:hypothetical protein